MKKLFFEVENAGTVFADRQGLAQPDFIEELGPELEPARAADLPIHLHQGKPLLFLNDQIIKTAGIGRDLLDAFFAGFLEIFNGFRQDFFSLADFRLFDLILFFNLLKAFLFLADFLFCGFHGVQRLDNLLFQKRVIGPERRNFLLKGRIFFIGLDLTELAVKFFDIGFFSGEVFFLFLLLS